MNVLVKMLLNAGSRPAASRTDCGTWSSDEIIWLSFTVTPKDDESASPCCQKLFATRVGSLFFGSAPGRKSWWREPQLSKLGSNITLPIKDTNVAPLSV